LWVRNLSVEGEQCKWIYLNCGERYELMIDHHSYTHNLSSKMKAPVMSNNSIGKEAFYSLSIEKLHLISCELAIKPVGSIDSSDSSNGQDPKPGCCRSENRISLPTKSDGAMRQDTWNPANEMQFSDRHPPPLVGWSIKIHHSMNRTNRSNRQSPTGALPQDSTSPTNEMQFSDRFWCKTLMLHNN